MSSTNPPNDQLKQLLTDARTIAIVGASGNPDKASHGIMQKLQSVGYKVIPVNPNETEILGERAYPSLLDIDQPVDIVDVFRKSEDTPSIAAEAIQIGAKGLWLQTGVSNEDAAELARAAGLAVVMDTCIGATHAILQVPRKN
jgi:predicted CoA-binding protein